MRRPLAWLVGVLVLVGASAPLHGCGGGGGGGGDGGPRSVLMVYAVPTVTYADDVSGKLTALGVFDTVDVFDANAATPSLSLLSDYDAVLVISDADFLDSVALGDNLADYVDQGGGVVLAAFCFGGGAASPEGRFTTDDYWVIPPSGIESGGGPFGWSSLPHPIFTGVTLFGAGASSYRPTGTVPGAYALIATHEDPSSRPLVATRTIGGVRRVDLGFYPPTKDTGRSDFVDAGSDAMLMVANALRWVSHDL